MIEEKKHKIFLFGLDKAGKTTLLKYLKGEKINENQSPTREYDIIGILVKDINFYIWDAPGQLQFRESWSEKVINSEILIFILDLSDKKRFNEAKRELDKMLHESDTKDMSLIVCFHKTDLKEGKTNLKEAFDTLKLSSIKGREVLWLKTSVHTAEGIEDLKLSIYLLLVLRDTHTSLNQIKEKLKL